MQDSLLFQIRIDKSNYKTKANSKYRLSALQNPNTALAVCEALDLIVEFKEKNPEDYADILALGGKILDEYAQNKDSIKQNLQELLD